MPAPGSPGASSSASSPIVPNVWPGWGTAGATTFTYLIGGGNPNTIAIIVLLAIGVALTTSPVVYKALERAEFFKVGLTIVFLAIAVVAGIKTSAWGDLGDNAANLGTLPTGDVAIATLLAGLVFAGAGGANNLVQSNWIREKGFGMGKYIPRIESPLTGEPEPAPTTGSMMRQDEENLKRFKRLVEGRQQGAARLVLGDLRGSRSSSSRCWRTRRCTARTCPTRPTSTSSRARARSSRTSSRRGSGRSSGSSARSRWCSWRWASSTTSARLSADVLKTLHLRDNERWSESKIYMAIVWTMCLVGCGILLSGFDQPLVLLVLAACLNGIVMFIYSILLIKLNRQGLPPAIRVRGFRLGALCFAVLFYGFFAGWYVIVQLGEIF